MQTDTVYGKQRLCKSSVAVGIVQYSPFTTVNSFVYFHNVPYNHNSSIVFAYPFWECHNEK